MRKSSFGIHAVLLVVHFSAVKASDRKAADDLAALIRNACFETLPSFDDAAAVFEQSEAILHKDGSSCKSGTLSRASSWHLLLDVQDSPISLGVMERPLERDPNKAVLICGFNSEAETGETLGRAAIKALSGLWDAGRRQRTSGTITARRSWTVVRMGVGMGHSVATWRQESFQFGIMFEKPATPCETS